MTEAQATHDPRDRLRALLGAVRLGVLATQRDGEPYATLVAFAAGEDLHELAFVTPRATRKYANLAAEPRASLLIDNRTNEDRDLAQAMAATAIGTVAEPGGAARDAWLARYVARHPLLENFARAPSCALCVLKVDRYVIADRFQEVTEWRVEP